jgi:MOSC domain-containing protein YiiM
MGLQFIRIEILFQTLTCMLTTAGHIASIQVGLPQRLGDASSNDPSKSQWFTGIFKNKIDGPVRLDKRNHAGDAQADLRVHGGPDKAVLAYSADHYSAWRNELKLPDFNFGAFGENFTVDAATEDDICIGDIHQIGDAILQVSQPRSPCWKLARKWEMSDLPKRVVQSGRSGWYYRVQQEGTVGSGQELKLLERPCPEWTIRRICDVTYGIERNPGDLAALERLDLLASQWREM